jgi:hypothetical protein
LYLGGSNLEDAGGGKKDQQMESDIKNIFD